MKTIIKGVAVAIAFFAFSTDSEIADPVEGVWKRPANKGGTLEQIAACGNSFCVTVMSCDFKGQTVGIFKKNGYKYDG
jgi:uncharacterized protein (DUF2147 family)